MHIMTNINKKYMDLAFFYAKMAYNLNEVPIGAVIVKDDEVVSYGFNLKEKNNSVLDHAEIIAIKEAARKLNNWRLDGCEIFVTLEPCKMCKSAIEQARISKIYVGTLDDKAKMANPDVSLEEGILKEECSEILKSFFKRKR